MEEILKCKSCGLVEWVKMIVLLQQLIQIQNLIATTMVSLLFIKV